MRSPPLLLVGLTAVCLLMLPAGARADAAPSEVAVPETRPIQLDGTPRKAEWDAAATLPLEHGAGELLVQQFRGTLMLALRSDLAWTPPGALTLWLCPDGPSAGADGPGAVRIEYEPFEHNREHVIVWHNGKEGWKRERGSVVARHAIRGAASALELALPLTLLGLEKDQRPGVRLLVQWARFGTASPTWPAGVDLRAPPGKTPPALASAKGWGLLTGWGDAAGPGAFSRSDWEAWVARDAEIHKRGAAAHEAITLLVEEWKKTKKRDVELVPTVLGNLRWIRTHERLTANDQLAMATLLRFLNRHRQALGMLEVLLDHPDEAGAQRARRERALLFESMQRYEDAAADWEALAAVTRAPWDASYRRAAETARSNGAAWAEEAKAREEDGKNTKLPRVVLRTNRGEIEILLHAEDVPDAVKHFLDLVGSKFYDGTLFHRVQGDFLAQGGDPISRDQGLDFAGSGTSPKEVALEEDPRHDFWRGAVGFARGMRDYNGSQFFLMTAPRPKLGEYTCFGHIVRGQEVADRLEYGDTLLEAVVVRP